MARDDTPTSLRALLAIAPFIFACSSPSDSTFQCVECAADTDCSGSAVCKLGYCVSGDQDPRRCPARSSPDASTPGSDAQVPAPDAAQAAAPDATVSVADSGIPDACSPSCSNKACGDDGCGGFCGKCSALQACLNGACVGMATPDAGPSAGLDAGGVVDYEWANWPVPPESPTDYNMSGGPTVVDNVTGLVWQVSTAQTFKWIDAMNYCSTLSLGSLQGGWRLPTAIELLSLVDSGRSGPAIDPTAFPVMPAIPLFWTSTPVPGSTASAWYVSFVAGSSGGKTAGSMLSARCVWTPLPATNVTTPGAPADQYTITPNIVVDKKTKLHWQRNASTLTYSWADAATYCQALQIGGFVSGWRVPTKKELETLVDRRAQLTSPTIDTTAFPSTPSAYFWTSTPYSGAVGDAGPETFAWVVGFAAGDSDYGNTSTAYNVRCVH